jgi:hypothetical protein
MEQIFLTQEELQQLKSLNEERADIVTKFGAIEVEIQSLELQKNKLTKTLQELIKQSELVGQTLQKKYGEGNINIETGEFIKQ